MRFFEFKLPDAGSKFDAELKGFFLKLVNKANLLPDTDPRKIKFIQQLDNTTGIGENVADITQVDNDTVNAVLAFLAKQGVKEATMFLMNTAKILGDTQVQAALEKKGKVHTDIEFAAGKDINNQLKTSAKMLAAKISGTLEAFKQQYEEQYNEGDPNAPKKESKPASEVNQELVDLIEVSKKINEIISKVPEIKEDNDFIFEKQTILDSIVKNIQESPIDELRKA
jgi:hypothetical protein